MSRVGGTNTIQKLWVESDSEEYQTLIIRDNF